MLCYDKQAFAALSGSLMALALVPLALLHGSSLIGFAAVAAVYVALGFSFGVCLCDAMRCYATLCCAMLCHAMLCYAMLLGLRPRVLHRLPVRRRRAALHALFAPPHLPLRWDARDGRARGAGAALA